MWYGAFEIVSRIQLALEIRVLSFVYLQNLDVPEIA